MERKQTIPSSGKLILVGVVIVVVGVVLVSERYLSGSFVMGRSQNADIKLLNGSVAASPSELPDWAKE